MVALCRTTSSGTTPWGIIRSVSRGKHTPYTVLVPHIVVLSRVKKQALYPTLFENMLERCKRCGELLLRREVARLPIVLILLAGCSVALASEVLRRIFVPTASNAYKKDDVSI